MITPTEMVETLEGLLAALPRCESKPTCNEPAVRRAGRYPSMLAILGYNLCDEHQHPYTRHEVVSKDLPQARFIRRAKQMLIELPTSPNLPALMINYGRAIYDSEEADAALKQYNDIMRREDGGSFSVFADAARDMNPAWQHRSRVQFEYQERKEKLAEQVAKLARSLALKLFNDQHPNESPRV